MLKTAANTIRYQGILCSSFGPARGNIVKFKKGYHGNSKALCGFIHSFDALRHACQLEAKKSMPMPIPIYITKSLVHLSDQSVDLVLTVTNCSSISKTLFTLGEGKQTISSFNEVLELSCAETTSGVAELEWPEEVGGLLEVGADSVDLVDQVFHADNAVLAEASLNESVVDKGNALLVDLTVSALVDELTDGLQVGVSVGDPWLNDLQHLKGSLGHANEDTVVDLEKTEELENLARLWCNLVDTVLTLERYWEYEAVVDSLPLDTDNKDQLLLSWDVEGTILLGQSGKTDLLALSVTVLLHILLSTLEDDSALLLLSLSRKAVSYKPRVKIQEYR